MKSSIAERKNSFSSNVSGRNSEYSGVSLNSKFSTSYQNSPKSANDSLSGKNQSSATEEIDPDKLIWLKVNVNSITERPGNVFELVRYYNPGLDVDDSSSLYKAFKGVVYWLSKETNIPIDEAIGLERGGYARKLVVLAVLTLGKNGIDVNTFDPFDELPWLKGEIFVPVHLEGGGNGDVVSGAASALLFNELDENARMGGRALSLAGGGAKGARYLALLDSINLDSVDTIGGSSAGALTATLLASATPAENVREIGYEPMGKYVSTNMAGRFNNSVQKKVITWMAIPKNPISPEKTDKLQNEMSDTISKGLEKKSAELKSMRQSSSDILRFSGNSIRRRLFPIHKHIVNYLDIVESVRGGVKDKLTFGVLDNLIFFDDKIPVGERFRHLAVTATKLKSKTGDEMSRSSSKSAVFSTKGVFGGVSGRVQSDNVPIVKAAAASAAFPGFFLPVEINGSFYIDGGVLNNVPTDEVLRMVYGVSDVLAIHLDKIDENRNPPGNVWGGPLALNRIVQKMAKIMGKEFSYSPSGVATLVKRKKDRIDTAISQGRVFEVIADLDEYVEKLRSDDASPTRINKFEKFQEEREGLIVDLEVKMLEHMIYLEKNYPNKLKKAVASGKHKKITPLGVFSLFPMPELIDFEVRVTNEIFRDFFKYNRKAARGFKKS